MKAELSQFRVVRPRNLDDALVKLADSQERLTPLAGGTDLYVYLNAGTVRPGTWLDLWSLPELRGIREADGWLVLGALTTYSELQRDPQARRRVPMLVQAAGTVGAVAIQNRGTLGGNIANGSPAGDSLPVLLAYDAEVGLRSARGKRWVPLDAYYTGYRASVMKREELIDEIRIPLEPLARITAARYAKVGTRAAQAISKVVAALALGRASDGTVRHCRLAYGSVAATPVRLKTVEDHLTGHQLDAGRVTSALEVLDRAMAPIDDIRSTERYRRFVSRQTLRRFLEDVLAGRG
jgi:CO/xanthine dehydrogenase FAD-binding subunit